MRVLQTGQYEQRNDVEKVVQRKILRKFPYGLFIIGSKTRHGVAAIVANWVSQVSFSPPMVMVAIEFDSEMRDYIEYSKLFSINVLPAHAKSIAKVFLKKSKHVGSTINGVEFTFSKSGVPFLLGAADLLECKVVKSVRTGDHVIFVAEIVDSVSNSDDEMLTLKMTGWRYSK